MCVPSPNDSGAGGSVVDVEINVVLVGSTVVLGAMVVVVGAVVAGAAADEVVAAGTAVVVEGNAVSGIVATGASGAPTAEPAASSAIGT